MNKEEILKIIISVLQEIEKNLGNEKTEITSRTRPIGDLAEFDSLTSITATIDCLECLKLNSDIQSLFVGNDSQGNPCALTVDEAADLLVEISTKTKK